MNDQQEWPPELELREFWANCVVCQWHGCNQLHGMHLVSFSFSFAVKRWRKFERHGMRVMFGLGEDWPRGISTGASDKR